MLNDSPRVTGQLHQLDYADQAVLQGSLALAASNGKDCIVLCVASERLPLDHEASESEDSEEESESDEKAVKARPSFKSGRSLAFLQDRSSNLTRKLAKVDDGVYMTFAGVAADGRVLLDQIRVSEL